MPRQLRAPLSLERMEDRWVPATVKFFGGNLIISNPTINNGTATLTVNQKADNTFQVVDGSASLGTYGQVSNLFIIGKAALQRQNYWSTPALSPTPVR